MGLLSLLAGSLNAHFPFFTPGEMAITSHNNLWPHFTNRLNVDQDWESRCDLVINLGHDDDNYYHIFNLHSSSPGDNNTLFVSSQVISQHQDKSVSLAPWLLFQGTLFMELDPAVLWSLLHSQLLLSFHLHCHFIDFLLLKYLQNI